MRHAILALSLVACTDFQFADELRCSGLGNCPPGQFCDTSADVCRVNLGGCGNAALEPGEVCDDGNRTTGDGCRSDCLKAELCGDGVQDPQEICDDGNLLGADGCSAACTLEGCGNGVLDEGEACDDGAANAITAACLPTCAIATCGDGFLRSGVEACDDGAANSDTAACLSTCVVATCGDGHTRAGVEACDDDNDIDTDNCLSSCAAPTCGDGNIQLGVELCDDGAGTACDASCRTAGVVQVVAGFEHTCVLRANGSVRCWGRGSSGQLGHGNTTTLGDDESPAPAGDLALGGIAIQLAAGDAHTCALLESGNVRCWGSGATGRLGYGNIANIGDDETPATAGDVAVGGTVVQLAASGSHTCALLSTGAVRCWGAGGNGRLGYGNTANIGDDETPASAGDVTIGGTVVSLVAGFTHTCATLANGKLRCWGAGDNGRLGYGNTLTIGDDESPATAGDVPVGGSVVQVAAGDRHTCAVLATGGVRCWGSGADGRLGLKSTTTIGDNEPASSGAEVVLGEAAAQVVAGERHTCALLTSGEVRCWGAGVDGRLGIKSTTTIGDDEDPSTTPRIKIGGTTVQLAAGPGHTCALISSGDVRCWGSGGAGRLGYASTANIGDDEDPAAPGDVFLKGAVMQVSTGSFHTCVIGDEDEVRCWGFGENGRLGYGNIETIGDDEAARVAGNVDIGGGRPIQISAGGAHTCVLLETGKVRCWGINFGRLGYGNTITIGDDEPAFAGGDVDIGGTVVQIVAGESHSCAVLDTGKLRCWGDNSFGKLGYGHELTIGDDETPASAGDIDVGGNVVQVAVGGSHTCALLDTGNVRCWGFGGNGFANDGRLGYGNSSTNNIGDDETPASAGDVPVGGTVVQITAGAQHTCALLDTGSVRCWGHPVGGKLGYGNNVMIGDNETPASVGDVVVGGTAVQISINTANTCARLATGNVRCWGSGFSGQLGHGNPNTIGDNETPASAGNIPVGGSVLQVDSGDGHTCARMATGRLRCWGSNFNGKLGRGDTFNIGDDETADAVGDVPVF